MRYADPSRCPDCGAPLTSQSPAACPACGLPLSGELPGRLFATLQTADRILHDMRASRDQTRTSVPAAAPAPATSTPAMSAPGMSAPAMPAGAGGATAPGSPPPTQHARGLLSGASVPRILLGLGAVCLLVAAVTFLAVAWSWLGVGGRTAILVALTAASGGLGIWLTRRGLRIAGEALTVVSLGLLALDVIGADDAGWLGDHGTSGLLLITGLVVVAAAVAAVVISRPDALVAPQVVSVIALAVAGSGLAGLLDSFEVATSLIVLAFIGLGVLGRSLRVVLLPWLALAGAGLWWLPLLGSGLDRVVVAETYRAAILDARMWPLVAAALLLMTIPLVARHRMVLVVSAAATLGLLTLAALLPSWVGSASLSAFTLGSAVALVGWAGALLVLPGRLRWLPVGGLAVAAVTPLIGAVGQSAISLTHALDADPYTRPVGDVLGAGVTPDGWVPVLLVPALLCGPVALTRLIGRTGGPARVVREAWPALAGLVLLTAAVALAGHEVPRAAVVAALVALVLGLGAAVALRLGRSTITLVVAALAAVLSLMVAMPSAVLLAAALVPVASGAALLALRAADAGRRTTGELVLPAAVALLAWTVGEVVSVPESWRGLLVIAAAGALALPLPRVALEAVAAAAAALATLVSLDAAGGDLTVLAVHLTLAGALVVATSLLHPQRRWCGWPGGVLLAAATWARLGDIGVEAPEAYALPSALALVALGLWHLRRQPGSRTSVLAPGLVLATVPSLLWVLAEPFTLRALLLGLACLVLVLAGTTLRWGTPLMVGGAVGLVLVLRELQPYAALMPPWLLIGFAGTLLTVVGVTWEARMGDLRRAGGYLTHLR